MEKEIKWNAANGDYDLYLGGRYVGSAASPSEARQRLDEMAYSWAAHAQVLTTPEWERREVTA